MADTQRITIDSVLGGHQPTTHFGRADQFRSSLGVDPGQPIADANGVYGTIASGLLRPAASQDIAAQAGITAAPLWLVPNPKDSLTYMYSACGSVYTINADFDTVSALGDVNDDVTGIGSKGNGSEYYDNYIYFARNTTIARYGPLNGAPAFIDDFWISILGLATLEDTTYPASLKNSIELPNHVMHRHSDGALYFAGTVGNQGVLHKIETTKTTVEGDTDDGSTHEALDLGYGLYPTALETYGSDLAIALYEGNSSDLKQSRAKLAFWDTVAGTQNKIIWVEFPDQIITALKNVNGALYVVSGNVNAQGFRVTRFIGGYSFDEVFYSETGEPPLPGAVDALLNRILIGSHTNIPDADGCVYSSGLSKRALGTGAFNIMRSTGGNASTSVTAMKVADNDGLNFPVPIIAWTQAGDGSTSASHGIDKQGTTYNGAPSIWWSGLFRIGIPFKITRIRIPLAQAVAANMIVTPTIYTDDGENSKALTAISNTNYSGKRVVTIRPDGLTGDTNFWLELKWTGSALCTVNLPIIIDWEPLPIDD